MTSSPKSPASNDISDLPCPIPLSVVPAGAAFSHPENVFPHSLTCPRPVLFFSGAAANSDLRNNISHIFSSPIMTMSSSLSSSGPSNSFPAEQASFAYPMSLSYVQRRMTSQRSSWSMQPPSWMNVLPTVPQARGPSSSVFRAEDSTPPQRTPSLGHSPECVVTLQSKASLTSSIDCNSLPVEATNKPRGRPRGSVNKPKFADDGPSKKCDCSSKDKSQVKVREADNSSKEGVLEESNADSETRRANAPGGKRQNEDVRGVKRKASHATEVGYETEKIVIEVKPGENIAHKIASFAESNNQQSVFVVSASGSVKEAVISPVVLSQVQVIQGEHEILALSGAFVLTENGSKDRAGFLTVMLRQLSEDSSSANNPPKVAIAGVLKGSLIAASNVKIYVMCIRGLVYRPENKSSKQKCVPESSAMRGSSS